jgi:hypothetical protein
MNGPNAAVCNGGMRIVPVGKEVAASCVTAAKFNACAILHSTLRTPVRPGVQECAFCKLLSEHYCNEYISSLSIFISDICSQQMIKTWHIL